MEIKGMKIDESIFDIVNDIAFMKQFRLPCPLCIVEDRYGGAYSGAKYLAFHMLPFSVAELDVDAGDIPCQYFWENEAEDYIIGKGKTPEEALNDLMQLLSNENNKNK